ncbi:MAG TPA: hypothetical protein VFA19_03830 [Gaiellaceae bacterium]|nr:hypothetical protein [Gaiellaceae bacterium]
MTRRAVVVWAAVAVLAGCGGAASTRVDRQWLQNTTGLVAQLRSDEVLTANGTSSLAAARHALHDDSDLYVLLVAYSDFGGCPQMLANTGGALADRSLAPTLRSACDFLARSAALFTRSAGGDDPHTLLAAAREAQRAWPLLDRAALELASRSR